jgi:glycerol-3-phosphate acyltransferase PlsY
MLAARWSAPGVWWLSYLGGMAAMIGHAWPLFARFRGGRCVLTFLGAIISINPVESLLALVVCLVLLAVLRRFSLAARAGVFVLPVVQAFFDPRARVAFTGAMMSLIGLRFGQAAWADRAGRAGPAADTAGDG